MLSAKKRRHLPCRPFARIAFSFLAQVRQFKKDEG
jgi:hypothetical protein